MCRYSHLVKCFILSLIANCSCAFEESYEERIVRLEQLLEVKNQEWQQLEAQWATEMSGNLGTTEEPASLGFIRELEEQLNASKARTKAAETELRQREDYFMELLQNLTSCQISLLAKQEEAELQLTKLATQLKLKDEQIEQTKSESEAQELKLQAALAKIGAYERQLEEFQPSSCMPFGSANGIYKIKLPHTEAFYVPCDARLAGSGWLVIQRRMDGSVDFYRNWTEYRAGFGSLNGEFFLGLEKLHRLTERQPYELYVHLEDFEGEIRFAHYDNFSVGSEQSGYQLSSLGRYDGTAGNSLGLGVLQKFSTRDRDNDAWPEGSCARRYHSAWWYASCAAFCNPNGKYFMRRQLSPSNRGIGIIWQHWHGFEETLKFVQLMIRPISTTHF